MIDNQRHHLSDVVPKWKSGISVYDLPGYDHTEIFLLKQFTTDQLTKGYLTSPYG